MSEEFNLSDKWFWSNSQDYQPHDKAVVVFKRKDVKEFIKRLKEKMVKNKDMMSDELFDEDPDLQRSNFWINESTLDKLAGPKLTEEKE